MYRSKASDIMQQLGIAEHAKMLYNKGVINRAEAKRLIYPYISAFNKRQIIIAKKYGQSIKKLSLVKFLR